jgi:XTP/dITP diphosphohydrolase
MYFEPLVFASANNNKIEEINYKLQGRFSIKGLQDIGCLEELAETGADLVANAQQKAWYVWEHYGVNVFADDTGLEVEALGGLPGVNTAFFGGPERSAEKNMQKLLHELALHTNRAARFRTVICLIMDGTEYLFEGTVVGEILTEKIGSEGFGYDPLFKPLGSNMSFAQMTMDEKNQWSHRGRALAALQQFLEEWSA